MASTASADPLPTDPLYPQSDPGWADRLSTEQWEAVVDAIYRARGEDAMPYTVAKGTAGTSYPENFGDAEWQAESTVTAADFTPRAVEGELDKARTDAGVMPKLLGLVSPTTGFPVTALGTAALTNPELALAAGGTLAFGFAIGTAGHYLYKALTADSPPNPNISNVALTYTGTTACHMNASGCGSAVASQPDMPVIPANSWWVTFYFSGGGWTNLVLQRDDPCRDMPEPQFFRISEGLSYGRCAATVPAHAYYWQADDWVSTKRGSETEPGWWQALSSGAKAVIPWPNLPSLAESEAALKQEMESAQAAMVRQIITYSLDTFQTGGQFDWHADDAPLGTTTVPASTQDEGVDDYAAALRSRNLVVTEHETAEYNYEDPPGTVEAVNPATGQRVKRGTTVDVAYNPRVNVDGDQPADDNNRRCELSAPGGSDPLPGYGTDRGVVAQRRGWYTPFETFAATSSSGGSTQAIMRVGYTVFDVTNWVGWGYRHIWAKHGYGADDEIATQEALLTVPQQSTRFPTRLLYTGAHYQQTGAICARRVVVDRSTTRDPDKTNETGIVTSFGMYLGEAP